MDIYTKQTKINVPVEKLFKWHENKGAILRLTPLWAPLKLIWRSGLGIKKGISVKFKIYLLKIPFDWHAEHIEYQKNKIFVDRQTKGVFAKWEHIHEFEAITDTSSIMKDKIKFKLPFGFLSYPFYGFAKKEFERMFSYRHRVLKHDLENNDFDKKRILISGSSGTIGSILVPYLQAKGHEVIKLVRKKENLLDDEIFWNPYKGILNLKKEDCFDAVINLNGVDISKKRWTQKQKKIIIDSRVIPTKFLTKSIQNLEKKPKVFISSSAIGFYGGNQDELLNENSSKGDVFIAQVCEKWENASLKVVKAGIRTINLRTGIVLTPTGGALAKMQTPFKIGLGVFLSNGKQYMSWISIDDVLSAILYMIHNENIKGPVNLTSPYPVDNKEFSKTLANAFGKKVFFTLPKFMVKLIWGEMGETTLLSSMKAMPEKLLNNGFSFQHKNLLQTFKDILGK